MKLNQEMMGEYLPAVPISSLAAGARGRRRTCRAWSPSPLTDEKFGTVYKTS